MSGSFAYVLLVESRAELLKTIRLPMFLLPAVLFPAMFYGLFGLAIGGGAPGALSLPAYLLATYGAFGVIGAALFGMGVGVAAERGQGWLLLKRATPMPPAAYFLAKVFMSMVVGATVFVLLAVLSVAFGDVQLATSQWLRLAVVLVGGAVPFCVLGCMLGFLAGPNSAPLIANLVYLPMSLASGLWLPIEYLPKLLQSTAVYLPPYHLAQLALGVVRAEPGTPLVHVGALLAFTLLFLGAAVVAFRRDDGRTWG